MARDGGWAVWRQPACTKLNEIKPNAVPALAVERPVYGPARNIARQNQCRASGRGILTSQYVRPLAPEFKSISGCDQGRR